MAVLLLLIVFQESGGMVHLWPLAVILGGSLVALQLVEEVVLGRWWFQAAFFVGDAVAATATLRWLTPKVDLFLLYITLVFGSALTRSARQRSIIAAIAILLQLVSGWSPTHGWPHTPEFWLRTVFLAVSAALMAVLARDARQAQDDQVRRFEERLVQVGRLATLGRVAGEVAHRIKGPLTTISVDAEVLAHRLTGDADAQRDLREIRDEVERCKSILKDLLDLGRIEEMDVASIDLRVPVRAALKAIGTRARARSVRIKTLGLTAPLRVRADASLIQEALSALLQNALEAVPDGGEIRVRTVTVGGFHRVDVIDGGIGISPDDLERIFEPFFTTKKTEGSGLGLSAALRIAAKHGGSVEADSAGPMRGATFSLRIPAASA